MVGERDTKTAGQPPLHISLHYILVIIKVNTLIKSKAMIIHKKTSNVMKGGN